MPAKKTFSSIRVRGVAQFDAALSRQGKPVPAFREYAALLNQVDEGDPVATVLVNTLGGEVVWARTGAGQYVGTLAGAFPADKTLVIASAPTTDARISAGRPDANMISIDTTGGDGLPVDSLLQNYAIDIRVY